MLFVSRALVVSGLVLLVEDIIPRPAVLHLEVLEVVEVVDHVAVEAARVRVPGVARLHLPALRRAQDGLHVSRIHVRFDLVVQEARDLVGQPAHREHAGQALSEVIQLLAGQAAHIVAQLLERVVCLDGVFQQFPHDLVEAVGADAVGDDFAGRFLLHARQVVLLVHVQLVDGLAGTLEGQETDDRDGFAGCRLLQHTHIVVRVAHAGGVGVADGDRAVTDQERAGVVDVVDGHVDGLKDLNELIGGG